MTTTAGADLFLWSGRMIRFLIHGETPSKKNSRIFTKSGLIIPSKAHGKWHTDALLQMNAQLYRMGSEAPNLMDYPLSITLTFYHGDYVRRDSDNQATSVMDLLQDSKVLKDDNWKIVRELNIRNLYEKGQPRVLIEITKCEEKL